MGAGGSAGIGAETVRQLARAGARVLLAARDLPAAHAVAEQVMSTASCKGCVEVRELDLADLGSVQRCARSLVEERQLDVRARC